MKSFQQFGSYGKESVKGGRWEGWLLRKNYNSSVN